MMPQAGAAAGAALACSFESLALLPSRSCASRYHPDATSDLLFLRYLGYRPCLQVRGTATCAAAKFVAQLQYHPQQ